MNDVPGAFTSVLVQPNYGRRSAFVSWSVAPKIQGVVRLYRSMTGTAPWQLLNADSLVAYERGYFEDLSLVTSYSQELPWYRVLLTTQDELRQASEPVTVFGPLRADERAGIATMLQEECGLFRAAGTQALAYLPRKYGEPAWASDSITQEVMGTCNTDTPETGFGMPFAGGYAPPVATSVIPLSQSALNFARDESGRAVSPSIQLFRIPPFPQPDSDMLIVLPHSDDRFVISGEATPFKFKGTYPLAYEARFTLLPRTDPRYRIPVLRPKTSDYFET